MRKFAVIGTTVALLGGSTAAMSIASTSAAPNAAAPTARVLHLLAPVVTFLEHVARTFCAGM